MLKSLVALWLTVAVLCAPIVGFAKSAASAVVTSDRRIVLVGLPQNKAAYNPSITSFGTGFLLLFRIDASETPTSTRIGAVALDEHFAQVGNVSFLELRPPNVPDHTAEDPRVLWVGNELYLVYNVTYQRYPDKPRGINLARLEVTTDDGGGVVVTAPAQARLILPRGYVNHLVEKNWTPFVYDNQLHFIYTTNGPHIMRLPGGGLPDGGLKDGYATVTLEDVSHDAPTIRYADGEMRGGTPALWDAEQHLYTAFFHGKYSKKYPGLEKFHATISFYAFAPQAPFEILKVYDGAIEPEGLHDDDTPYMSCAYPGGYVRRGDRTYVVYGWQDTSIHLLEIDHRALWAALRDVP